MVPVVAGSTPVTHPNSNFNLIEKISQKSNSQRLEDKRFYRGRLVQVSLNITNNHCKLCTLVCTECVLWKRSKSCWQPLPYFALKGLPYTLIQKRNIRYVVCRATPKMAKAEHQHDQFFGTTAVEPPILIVNQYLVKSQILRTRF